ncbi:hypothetical protein Jiend_16150 [Micromonospora endophytica]|nr:hypothetical protein Jiend_16150 [Micromonospora endophytica]
MGGEHGGAAVASGGRVEDADDDSGDAGVDEFLAAGRGDADVVAGFECDDGGAASRCGARCAERVHFGVGFSFAAVIAGADNVTMAIEDDAADGRVWARGAQAERR